MAALDKDHNGIAVLCSDGVVRSVAPNKTVLAYQKLDSEQIQKLIDQYGRDDKLTKIFDGVNGNDVVDSEQLLHPSTDILPEDFGE